ncbi:MAG: hypothetical protein SGPRY_013565, partial [Prymnesium sp.]
MRSSTASRRPLFGLAGLAAFTVVVVLLVGLHFSRRAHDTTAVALLASLLRFLNGEPSNDLSAAGILIRQFDGLENQARPWEPCLPGSWCFVYSDRFASSLINQKQPLLYSRTAGGFILNPSVARVLCAYYSDGGSQKKQCSPPGVSDRCSPGCARTCSQLRDFRGCSWPASGFQQMMEQQQMLHSGGGHNEVVVDGHHWVENLPSIILAAVMVDGEKDTAASKHAWSFTRKARSDF